MITGYASNGPCFCRGWRHVSNPCRAQGKRRGCRLGSSIVRAMRLQCSRPTAHAWAHMSGKNFQAMLHAWHSMTNMFIQPLGSTGHCSLPPKVCTSELPPAPESVPFLLISLQQLHSEPSVPAEPQQRPFAAFFLLEDGTHLGTLQRNQNS